MSTQELETPRKFALTKIAEGDYLLPSNDGMTIWRLRKYFEDGSAEVELWSGKRKRLTGQYWSVHRYVGPRRFGQGRFPVADDVADWSNWQTFDSVLRTRQDAIRAALRAKN